MTSILSKGAKTLCYSFRLKRTRLIKHGQRRTRLVLKSWFSFENVDFLERSTRRSSRSRSRDRKSRRHRDRSREKESKRRRSRSPHESNNRRKHSRSRSPKDRTKKENKTEKQPLKKYKYWDVPPVGFEHITPVQYKAMQGKLSSDTFRTHYDLLFAF